jgi:hypothetical protein
MKGIPKHLNTKKDIEHCLTQWPEKTKVILQRMLESRFAWVIDKKLADGESGTTDDTHKVTEVTDDAGNVVERYQMEWGEDPAAQIFRLGFSVSDVEGLL